MATPGPDPFKTLGVNPNVTDAELRAAYRRLVQLHHPDHNNGSPESARRFEEVQEAYARIRELRSSGRAARGARAGTTPQPPSADPDLDSRLADIERQLRDARLARERASREAAERARQAAREAAAAADASRSDTPGRASHEDLGYVTTDDSFSKIIADARSELSERFSEAREHPVAKRVSDLIDELDELVSEKVRKPKR